MHSVAPAEATNWPKAQLEQDDVEADAAKVPAKQVEHTLAPVPEYFPASQVPVTSDKPVEPQYEPAVHAPHVIAPDTPANDPAAHLRHAVILENIEYCPGAQTEHEELETADEKEPAAHAEHTLAPAAEYWPAGHDPVTTNWPVKPQY